MNNGLDQNLKSCKLFNKSNKFSKIIKILFDNTQYYTRKTILKDLELNINKWKNERQNLPLYVILPVGKIGSEYYFYYHFKKILPKHKLILNVFPSINEESELLYLDDWSLTGHHCWNAFNDVIFTDEDHQNFRYPNIPLKCTVIVSITTNESLKFFTDDENLGFIPQCNFNYYYSHIIRKFNDILIDNGFNYEPFDFKNDFILICDFYEKYNCSKHTAYPVHLDYKIANVDGSFPNIYIHCRSKPVKTFMSDTHKYFENVKRDHTMFNSNPDEENENEDNEREEIENDDELNIVLKLKESLSESELQIFNDKLINYVINTPTYFDYSVFIKDYFKTI